VRKHYTELMHKIRANEVAAKMFQNGVLSQSELNTVQDLYSRSDVSSAEYLLNVVLARLHDAAASFVEALDKTNQLDAYLILVTDGLYTHALSIYNTI